MLNAQSDFEQRDNNAEAGRGGQHISVKLYENKMFAGRSKMTVILFAAITVVLVVVFITGFINEERTQRLEATKLQLTESAERELRLLSITYLTAT